VRVRHDHAPRVDDVAGAQGGVASAGVVFVVWIVFTCLQ
jgi:hypothetical protein